MRALPYILWTVVLFVTGGRKKEPPAFRKSAGAHFCSKTLTILRRPCVNDVTNKSQTYVRLDLLCDCLLTLNQQVSCARANCGAINNPCLNVRLCYSCFMKPSNYALFSIVFSPFYHHCVGSSFFHLFWNLHHILFYFHIDSVCGLSIIQGRGG